MCKFQPKQLEAMHKLFDIQTKYLLYGGAVGGGKSYFLRWIAVALGMYYFKRFQIKNVPIGLFSEDYPTLKDRQVVKIKQEFPEVLGELKESRDEGLVFKGAEKWGGFVIMLRNLDDPSKYKSTEFAAVLVEELTKNTFETFTTLRSRLRYPSLNEIKFVGATNPGEIGHSWVKKLWIAPDPKNPDSEQDRFVFVPANVYDNKFIDGTYVKQLEALPEQQRKAWLEGSWDVFEGQVFSEWARKTHVVEPFVIPSEWKKYVSMDWGINKPSAINWYAQDFEGHVYLTKELYLNGAEFLKKFEIPLTPKRLAKVIMSMSKRDGYEYCVADPSLWNKTILTGDAGKPEGESVAEQMMTEGLKMIRGDNDRMNGLQRFRQALAVAPDGKPYYMMFSTCYNNIRTIPAMVYDKTRMEDVDTDGEDHCYDSSRYFFMSRPIKPSEERPKEENRVRDYFKSLLNKNDEETDEEKLWEGWEQF